jgi:hypothetical protein
MPTDLEPFFKHMVEVVEPLYHQKMARILQVAVNARQHLYLQFYMIHDYEDEDSDYALNLSTSRHSPDQLESTLEPCRRRINAQCGGLLEIKGNRVEFLHRTVPDFFLTREMSDFIFQKGRSDFKVNLSTLKGCHGAERCHRTASGRTPGASCGAARVDPGIVNIFTNRPDPVL